MSYNKNSILRYALASLVLILFIGLSSCRDDFETQASSGHLRFSKDTVYLDTIFTNIGSSTYNLKVYNPSKKDIHIPHIKLGKGAQSHYRLNVDGIPGQEFHDITLLAKDSLFVFIETTVDIEALTSDKEFLYTDQLIFSGTDNDQEVELVTLVRDAIFLYPQRFEDGSIESLQLGVDEDGNAIEIEGFFLDDDHLNFSSELPYVIYGYAAVPPDKTLSIDAGSRIHFHRDSGIIVANRASIQANGLASNDRELMENEIIFQGNRLEPGFANTPGQWGTIWLTNGSTNNLFHYSTIKNATVGLLIEGNDGVSEVDLKNVQIYNHATNGILARTAYIRGENVIVAHCGQTALAATYGGKYNFTHATFANYWNRGHRNLPSVLLSNQIQVRPNEFLVEDLEEANFNNCIIYGRNRQEFLVSKNEAKDFNFKLNNSLVRLDDLYNELPDIPEYDKNNETFYNHVNFNLDPKFHDIASFNFRIDLESPAVGLGSPIYSVPLDLDGQSRNGNPDAGAYQATATETEE